MKSTGEPELGTTEEQESTCDCGMAGSHPEQKDRHCGLWDRARKATLRKTRDSWAGCELPDPETYSTPHGHGAAAVPPIRSPARAAASQCWLLEEEAAGNTRYCPESLPRGHVPPPCCRQPVQQTLAAPGCVSL